MVKIPLSLNFHSVL